MSQVEASVLSVFTLFSLQIRKWESADESQHDTMLLCLKGGLEFSSLDVGRK